VGNNNGTTTYGGILTGSGSLVHVGSGMLTLSNSNNYSGTTLVSGGSLVLSNTAALSMSTLNASGTGTLSFGTLSTAIFGGLTGSSGTLALNCAGGGLALSVGNNNGTTTFDGVLAGSGSLIQMGSGMLTLTGVNTYSGSTTISGGTLAIGGGDSSVPVPTCRTSASTRGCCCTTPPRPKPCGARSVVRAA